MRCWMWGRPSSCPEDENRRAQAVCEGRWLPVSLHLSDLPQPCCILGWGRVVPLEAAASQGCVPGLRLPECPLSSSQQCPSSSSSSPASVPAPVPETVGVPAAGCLLGGCGAAEQARCLLGLVLGRPATEQLGWPGAFGLGQRVRACVRGCVRASAHLLQAQEASAQRARGWERPWHPREEEKPHQSHE